MPAAAKPSAKRSTKTDSHSDAKNGVEAPSQEAIAKRAYELYLQRGSVSGYELEDWLAAEAELIASAVGHG